MNSNKFEYSYSAKQQEEIKKIREKYVPNTEDKMEKLRRLDAAATQKGVVVSLILGIVGCLLLGIGMCCTMVWSEGYFMLGIIVGIIGIALISLAYPVYSHITKKERERIAPEIIRLADELLK